MPQNPCKDNRAVLPMFCLTQLVLSACSCAAKINAFVCSVRSEILNYFHVSSLSVRAMSYKNFPHICLSFHFLICSFSKVHLNSVLLYVLLYSITPVTLTPCRRPNVNSGNTILNCFLHSLHTYYS